MASEKLCNLFSILQYFLREPHGPSKKVIEVLATVTGFLFRKVV